VIDQASLERAAQRFQPPEGSFERLVVRRARRQRNRRIGTGVVAVMVTLVSFPLLIGAFRSVGPPAHEAKDIFAGVQGWIAYGSIDGIWAVDPDRPQDPEGTVRLSDLPGEPVAWSNDGSTLLVLRAWSEDGTVMPVRLSTNPYNPEHRLGLVVLHHDGTETRVVTFDMDLVIWRGYSLSPDGSQVVFVEPSPDELSVPDKMFVVDAEGGPPRLIRSTSMEPFVIRDLRWRGELLWPAWSPDGTQIAYFHGGGDHSENLKVMSADGTDVRGLFGDRRLEAHVQGLVWSPDGSQLAFATDDPHGIWGIWVIGADGSGYRRVIGRGTDPSWSPDGSRIAFERGRMLFTVTPDGSDLQKIGEVARFGGIAWNPVG
jgi:WD40 repeat protein